jgi:hypothetical protein
VPFVIRRAIFPRSVLSKRCVRLVVQCVCLVVRTHAPQRRVLAAFSVCCARASGCARARALACHTHPWGRVCVRALGGHRGRR